MTKINHRTLALATVSLMTAACTSATAGTYAKNNVAEIDQIESQLNPEQKRVHKRVVVIKSRQIAEEAMEAAQEALAEAQITIREFEIDEGNIRKEVERTVRLALIDVEGELKDMEIEFNEFDDMDLIQDLEGMRHGLERAVEEEHLTKKEMDRILKEVEKSREEALSEVREALDEIREALQELREEARRARED